MELIRHAISASDSHQALKSRPINHSNQVALSRTQSLLTAGRVTGLVSLMLLILLSKASKSASSLLSLRSLRSLRSPPLSRQISRMKSSKTTTIALATTLAAVYSTYKSAGASSRTQPSRTSQGHHHQTHSVQASSTSTPTSPPLSSPPVEIRGSTSQSQSQSSRTPMYKCERCGGLQYRLGETREVGGLLSKILNLQVRRFLTVTCARCGFTEFFNRRQSIATHALDFIVR